MEQILITSTMMKHQTEEDLREPETSLTNPPTESGTNLRKMIPMEYRISLVNTEKQLIYCIECFGLKIINLSTILGILKIISEA